MIGECHKKLIERLRSSGYSIATDVRFEDQTFVCVATKTTFGYWEYGFGETFFVLAEFDSPDMDALNRYSAVCFRYASQKRRVPLPNGLLHSTWCYSVALVHGLDSAMAQAISTADPRRHWVAYEFPVVYDLATGLVYYSEKSPWTLWTGYMYWDLLRDTAVNVLGSERQVDVTTFGSAGTETTTNRPSPRERFNTRFLESVTLWVSFPEFCRWQAWVRFFGFLLVFAMIATLVLGWGFGVIAMGLCFSLVALAPYLGLARRLLLRIIGSSNLGWPPPRMKMILWRVAAVGAAAVAALLIYVGASELLHLGFSGQNIFLGG